MASALALGPVCQAALLRLKTADALLAFVPAARISDEADARPTYPYVLAEGGGERPFNTMGAQDAPKWGAETEVRFRVVSQYRGESEIAAIVSAIKARLDGEDLFVPGYPTVIVAFESLVPMKDTINGLVTREWLCIFTVTVHQS